MQLQSRPENIIIPVLYIVVTFLHILLIMSVRGDGLSIRDPSLKSKPKVFTRTTGGTHAAG